MSIKGISMNTYSTDQSEFSVRPQLLASQNLYVVKIKWISKQHMITWSTNSNSVVFMERCQLQIASKRGNISLVWIKGSRNGQLEWPGLAFHCRRSKKVLSGPWCLNFRLKIFAFKIFFKFCILSENIVRSLSGRNRTTKITLVWDQRISTESFWSARKCKMQILDIFLSCLRMGLK